MIFFTVIIKKRPTKERMHEELRNQKIQRQLDDVKTNYMRY